MEAYFCQVFTQHIIKEAYAMFHDILLQKVYTCQYLAII